MEIIKNIKGGIRFVIWDTCTLGQLQEKVKFGWSALKENLKAANGISAIMCVQIKVTLYVLEVLQFV